MAVTTSLRSVALTDIENSALPAAALGEGYRFVDRLVVEWRDGTNRFEQPGETLLGVFAGNGLVAVGGLNRNPYSAQARVGRLRHFYVLPDHRGAGIGRRIVIELGTNAGVYFDRIRRRTADSDTGQFYQSIGFRPSADADATHECDVAGLPKD